MKGKAQREGTPAQLPAGFRRQPHQIDAGTIQDSVSLPYQHRSGICRQPEVDQMIRRYFPSYFSGFHIQAGQPALNLYQHLGRTRKKYHP